MIKLDRRLNAYRSDLANELLCGKVEASRYVSSTPMQVSVPVLDLRAEPRPDSGPQTQVILGDTLNVFEEQDGWCWVQAERDGYVGYASAYGLEKLRPIATHIVRMPRTFIYPGPDLRFPHSLALSMGSRIRVVGFTETRGTQYALLENGEALIAAHLSQIDTPATDYVAIAETMLHTPYLWGGTSGFGIDCSGLVQLSMWIAGRKVLRDTDMQETTIGTKIKLNADYRNLERGDLVFWKGHVAICTGPDTLIHANGHTMTVALEPVKDTIERIAYLYEMPTSIRRP